MDDAGRIYVADYTNNRVQVFDSEGSFITKFGSYGTGQGQFNLPINPVIDRFGAIYVADASNHRVQKFKWK